MADFLLSVGVDVGLSYDEMRKGIEQVVSRLNANPPKVKLGLDIDNASIDRFRTQVTQITSQLANLGGNVTVGAGGVNAAAVENVTKKIREANTELSDTANRLNVIKATLTEIQTTNRTITSAYKNLKTALGGENATGQNAADLELLKQKYIELMTAVEALRAAKGTATQEDINNIYVLQANMQMLIGNINDRIIAENEAASAAEARSAAEIDAAKKAQAAEEARALASKKEAEQKKHDEAERQSLLQRSYNLLMQMQHAEQGWTAARNGKSSTNYLAIQRDADELERLISCYERGEITAEEFRAQLANLNTSFKANAAVIKENAENTKTFGERVGSLSEKFTTWFSITRVIMAVYRVIRKMVSATIELDDAMTQLQIVTRETDSAMESFGDNAAATAKRIGSSITDFVDSATTYARLGYSLEDSSMLAEYTAMLQNVGNIDVGDAQDAITAIIKAYDGIDINNIEQVMDKLVTTGNNFPISVAQIAEGMNNASSTLAAAGNTFEQSVALLTAANTTIQNAAKSSTGLRTITARIRNTKADLDELGEVMTKANYEEIVQQLTQFNVALTDVNGEYRSTYDIMADIAAKWGDMTSMEQAAMATALAGTRQQAVFYSIIQNFQEASGAMDAMANSAGALDTAYSTYMESATAHINQFKAAFQEFSSNLITSGTISFIVDIGTGIVNVLNALQKLHLLLPSIVATIAIIKGIGIAKAISASTAKIATLTASLVAEKGATDVLAASVSQLTIKEKQRLAVNIQNAVASGQLTAQEGAQILTTLGLTTAEGGLIVANKGLAASFKSLMASIPVWGWIALGISLVLEAINLLTSGLGGATRSLQDIQEELNQLDSEIQQISDNYRNLKQSADEVIPRFVELAAGVDKFGKNVKLTDEEYEEFLNLNNKIAEMFPELNLGMDDNGNAMLALSFSADTLRESLEALLEVQRQEANEQMAAKMPEKIDKTIELVDEYNDQITELKHNISTIESGQFQRFTFGDEYSALADAESIKEFYDYVDYLTAKGIKVTTNVTNTIGTNAFTYTATWDSASSQAKNAVAGYLKEIDNLSARIESKWKSVNPSVTAWLQSDYLYNDMNSQMQGIAKTMVAALDFNELGLVGNSGEETAKNIQSYITQYVINPLYSAAPDVKLAFEEAISELKAGEITEEEFTEKIKGAFDKLLSGMDASEVENFKTAFVNGFNAMGIAGSDFDEVVDGLIQSWGKFGDTDTSGFSSGLDDLAESMSGLKSAYSILSKAESEMATGGLSADTIAAMAKETDDYLDYLYEENGIIKLNTSAWKEYANAKMADSVNSLRAETEQLKKEREELERQREELKASLEEWENKDGRFRSKNDKIAEYTQLLEENTEALDKNGDELSRNEQLLNIYATAYDNLTGSTNAYTEALSNFANVANAINGVSDALTTVADLQETVANGFTISLEKALEFAAVYPEILNGATVSADGQIALNEDVVNAFIEGKEAELKAQIDAKIAELESEKGVLTAKMNFAQAELDLAKSVGEGEGQISQELAEYRVNAGNAVAQALIEAGIDEATAYQLAMAAMSQNSEEFNRIAAQVCTDVDGNFNSAAYSAAQAIYNNMKNASSSLDGIIRAAHNAAAAIAGIGSGTQAGSTGSFSGSGGTTSGGAKITLSQGTFNGVDYSYTPKTVSLDQFISDLELDISSYSSAIAQIDGQIATLKALRNTSLNKFSSSSKKGGSGGSGSGNKGSGSSSSSKEESWFEQQYKLHQHLLNMDAEEVADYLDWLNDAYQRAYKEGIIDLNDFYKYQEEVYKKLQDLFKDYLNDVEHEIDMRSEFEGESKKIISLYKKLIADVEKEIKAARAAGLDDTDDYIQELQKKWSSYRDSIKDIEDDIKDNAKDAVDELIDIRIKMLKQDIDNEKDAIKKKLDYLKDFYQKQKDMLQEVYDEEKYLEEQSEKRKTVADIQAELAQLEYDNSAWAQKRKLQLAEELADAQKDLDDFERDHALQVAQDELDELYELQEKELDAQTELLEAKENDAKALYEQALADIKNGSIQLYEEMIEWNNTYGDGISDTIKTAWEEAYKALQDYKDLYGTLYEGVNLANATGYTKPQESWDNAPVSGTNPSNNTSSGSSSGGSKSSSSSTTSTPKLDDATKRKVAAAIWNGGYGWGHNPDRAKRLTEVFGANNGIQDLVNRGVGKNDAAPGSAYTYLNMRKKFKGYWSGTRKAVAGLHAIDELGTETIFQSADGTKYKMFTGGEKVLNAKASNFLYDFANKGSEILDKIIRSFFGGSIGGITPPMTNNEINMGDIIVHGNADRATVSEIRRAQRESLETMLKELNKLNR